MRKPFRAARRLVLTGWLGLALLPLVTPGASAAAPPEKVHPDSAVFFAKAIDAKTLREALRQSQIGQLWNDPAMKGFRDDLTAKLEETGAKLKADLGVTFKDLYELPQGPVTLAVVPSAGEIAAAFVVTAEVGENAEKAAEVLTRATERGEKQGAKVSSEDFKGLKLTVIQPPKPEGDNAERPNPPIVWTRNGSVFMVGTDVESLKDLIANAAGREGSLGDSENYATAVKKLGEDAQAIWFSDLGKLLELVSRAGAGGENAANIEQAKAMADVLGVGGLKAAAGSITLNSGPFDSVTKTFVLAPAPLTGLLKAFPMPLADLRPEPWVPATVASYQSFSWDLDKAFEAINDLANMFQPGVLNVLEQQLVGPNGGEPLNLKKDIFDPLGDRISLITDYKKPITEESQRMVFGVSLEDPKAFSATLQKLIEIAGGAPAKREFQGTTIYDFEIPEMPNAGAGQNVQLRGPISVAVAKQTLFMSSEPTLLEQVLRGGGTALADSREFQSVVDKIPGKVSSITYVRPEESARVSYDMIKSGQFEKALQSAAVAGGTDAPNIGEVFDKSKLPDFSVFAKYLSAGGGYAVMEEDGLVITNFSLRPSNP